MRALLALLALTGVALAEPIPKIDVDQACRDFYDKNVIYFGPPEVQYANCFDEAQKNYEDLKSVWGSVDDLDQKGCIRDRTPPVAHTYYRLGVCVRRIVAARATEKRQRDEDERRNAILKREFHY